MFNLSSQKKVSQESRRKVRIQEKLPVSWQVRDASVKGQGRIRNLSETGLLLETNAAIPQSDNCVLSFESVIGAFLPSVGRMVWSKKAGIGAGSYLVGVEFIQPAQEAVEKLKNHITVKIAHLKSMESTKNIVGAVSVVVLAVLSGYIMTQYFAVQENYEQSTRLLLSTSTTQASIYRQVSDDLRSTKAVLVETQTMLEQAKTENAALQGQLQTFNVHIDSLTKENTKLLSQISDLEIRLKPFEGKVTTLEEGRTWRLLVKNRIRDIKIGIRDVNKKAQLARIAAQKEKDAILLAQGNQGFFIRGSKPITSNLSQPAESDKKLKVTVDLAP